jgi:hypothetical protein
MTINKYLFASALTMLVCPAFSQQTPTEMAQPVVEEGKRLYKSEMASWYGTDIFLEKFKDRSRIGGYFSYTDHEIAKCIFFSKSDHPVVLGQISFDSSYALESAIVNLEERDFNLYEKDLYAIRKIALGELNGDTALFKRYNNINFNIIPLITGDDRKVYVLSGPQQNGVVIFGNDYLLTFNKDNQLASKRQLHKNIIPINFGEKDAEGKEVEQTMHTHLPETGEFITATDICTLMLYGKFTGWKQHNVVSKEYFNVWQCSTNSLFVIPMSTIERINKDQEKRHKK